MAVELAVSNTQGKRVASAVSAQLVLKAGLTGAVPVDGK
jgi:hypothetical protein